MAPYVLRVYTPTSFIPPPPPPFSRSALRFLLTDVASSCVPRSATSSAAPSSASQSSSCVSRGLSQDGSSPSSSAATRYQILWRFRLGNEELRRRHTVGHPRTG